MFMWKSSVFSWFEKLYPTLPNRARSCTCRASHVCVCAFLISSVCLAQKLVSHCCGYSVA